MKWSRHPDKESDLEKTRREGVKGKKLILARDEKMRRNERDECRINQGQKKLYLWQQCQKMLSHRLSRQSDNVQTGHCHPDPRSLRLSRLPEAG